MIMIHPFEDKFEFGPKAHRRRLLDAIDPALKAELLFVLALVTRETATTGNQALADLTVRADVPALKGQTAAMHVALVHLGDHRRAAHSRGPGVVGSVQKRRH